MCVVCEFVQLDGAFWKGPRTGGLEQVRTRARVERLRCERGQSIVEFALVLPLIFALIFLLVYAGVGFNKQLLVTDAARVAARAGAVDRFDNPGASSCVRATEAAQATAGSSVTVACDPTGLWGQPGLEPGEPFRVTVTYTLDVRLPFLPLSDIDISSTATERLE
jgi:Flp pilus assembly protein TadG